jgi:hypothetical protein
MVTGLLPWPAPLVAADPDPLVAAGSVSTVPDARTLVVRPAEPHGQVGRIWSWGCEELADGEAPDVWAVDARRKRQLAPGRPGGDGSLRFSFSDATYNKLVGTPGLRASILVDRGNGWIMNVRLHHGRKAA